MLSASKQVATPMVCGVTIIAVVHIPILALTGIEGKMFHPMALIVILAMGGALVPAPTLMPVLCSLLLGGNIREGDNRVIQHLKRLYATTLAASLRMRWVVVVAALLLFAGSARLCIRLGAEFVPTLDEGSITAMLYKPVGMSVEESLRTDIEVENKLLAELPEISRVLSLMPRAARMTTCGKWKLAGRFRRAAWQGTARVPPRLGEARIRARFPSSNIPRERAR